MRRNYALGKRRASSTQRTLILVAVCTICAVMLAGLAFHLIRKPDAQMQVASKKSEATPIIAPVIFKPGLPIRIQIPRINVDTKIDYMGLTKSGDMDAPVNLTNAGWYKHGPNPGNEGSAVIAGHRTGLKGAPGLFGELDKLQKGDSIIVIDDKDQIIKFVVREARSYDQNEKPVEVFSSSSGSHLNLITCSGNWVVTDSTFSKRLVVFSDKYQ